MKKVQKKIVADGGARDDVAPAWFAPAIQVAMRDALKDYPTKDDLNAFTTKKDLLDMSEHLVGIMLNIQDQMVTKVEFNTLKIRFDRSLFALGDHETRLIHLEGKFS